jgi:PAS domain S-box-containing protein
VGAPPASRSGAGRAVPRVSARDTAEALTPLTGGASGRPVVSLSGETTVSCDAESRLAAVVRSCPDAMFSTTPGFLIDSWSPGAEHLIGFPVAAVIGRHVGTIFTEDVDTELFETARRLAAGGPATPMETTRRRADGSVVEVASTMSIVRDSAGHLIGYSISLRDLTERRKAQQHLVAALSERDRLVEQSRLASAMHDRVTKQLFACGVALQAARGGLDPRPALTNVIEHVIDELDEALADIRLTLTDSWHRPSCAVGVQARLVQLGSDMAPALGFEPCMRFVGADDAVPDELADHLVSVAREALSNVLRHAHASRVGVMVQFGREVVIVVTDNGRGLRGAPRRFGLTSLEARADAAGGAFNLTSRDGTGSRLEWRAPLPAGDNPVIWPNGQSSAVMRQLFDPSPPSDRHLSVVPSDAPEIGGVAPSWAARLAHPAYLPTPKPEHVALAANPEQ